MVDTDSRYLVALDTNGIEVSTILVFMFDPGWHGNVSMKRIVPVSVKSLCSS